MSISTLARVFTPHGNIVYTANDFRQTLRIVFAGMIALSISSFYNTSYGVFFVVYPIMLLSLVPVFNRHVAKQFIFSASLNCVEMVIIIGYLCGLAGKFISRNITYVAAFYVADILMVSIDLALTFRNRALDCMAAKEETTV